MARIGKSELWFLFEIFLKILSPLFVSHFPINLGNLFFCENSFSLSPLIKDLISCTNTLSKKIFICELSFKDENGNEFRDWDTKKLKNIAHIQMGQSPDSSTYNTEKIGIPLIQGNADIKNRKSNPRQYTTKPAKLCEIGDILLTVRAPVGYVAKSMHKACIGRGICVLKSKENSNMEFLYQFLLSFENNWKSLEQGSTFTAVNSLDIELINVSFPTIPEQNKIANFLTCIDAKINIEKKLMQEYLIQQQYLLQNLFI